MYIYIPSSAQSGPFVPKVGPSREISVISLNIDLFQLDFFCLIINSYILYIIVHDKIELVLLSFKPTYMIYEIQEFSESGNVISLSG